MTERGVDTLLLSVGHDLPYLTGYLAMPLERLTMLVVPREGDDGRGDGGGGKVRRRLR